MFSLWHNLPFGWGMEAYCGKILALVKSASVIKWNNAFTVCTVSTTRSHISFTLTAATVTPCVYAENSEKYLVHL